MGFEGGGKRKFRKRESAAAALWLQKHRSEFSEKEWHGWQKSEAVYQALMKTSDRNGKVEPDRYLGLGGVRADDALKANDVRASPEQVAVVHIHRLIHTRGAFRVAGREATATDPVDVP